MLLLTLLSVAADAQQTAGAVDLASSGEQALARGEYFVAIEEFNGALAVNPNYSRAFAGLAEAYYWLSEYDQAAAFAERALRSAGAMSDLLTLAGRIAIGRGALERAAGYFSEALAREPNNVDARLGQAELALARGQSSEAISALERSLLVNPEHRKTLLSLVLIYEQTGRPEVAREYLELARRVHRDSSEVHVVAAQFFARAGQYEAAQDAAEMALLISPSGIAALGLLAEIAIVLEEFQQARDIAEQLLARDRNNIEAWYARAVSQYELGDVSGALTSVRTALAIDDNAEFARIWAEWIAVRELELEDPIRAELAAARSELASELEREFRFSQALRAYRRAIQLSPLDLGLRAKFAELHRRAGNDASYLQELELLVENGRNESSITRAIEIFRNALSDSVAFRWGVDQFTLGRTRTRIALYAPAQQSVQGYPQAIESVLAFLRRTFASETGIEVVDSAVTEGFSGAYERARAASVDYFIHVSSQSTDRLFALEGELYVGRTGASVGTAGAVRAGAGRVTATVDSLVSGLVRRLPLWARVVDRRGNRILIDRGERDGLSVGQQLRVLDPEAVTRAPASLGFSYAPGAQLATATVTAVDEYVAEATLVVSRPADLVSDGDLVLPQPSEEPVVPSDSLFPVLYERIRALR